MEKTKSITILITVAILLVIVNIFGTFNLSNKFNAITGNAAATEDSIADQTINRVLDNNNNNKPKVELFVMTYCPYGLQAEKGLIPVIKALGNKIDATIRFVDYFMHGAKEEQETYTQICIREEQNKKFLPYLECFAEKGDSADCLTRTGIDTKRLNTCIDTNAKKYYAKDSELSKTYGVQGSPTLILNNAQKESGRSSSAFLNTICSSFNIKPNECSNGILSQEPGPGFGTSASASNQGSIGGCGT